jgi:hypothetical protein
LDVIIIGVQVLIARVPAGLVTHFGYIDTRLWACIAVLRFSYVGMTSARSKVEVLSRRGNCDSVTFSHSHHVFVEVLNTPI